jgi:hypothetical protein
MNGKTGDAKDGGVDEALRVSGASSICARQILMDLLNDAEAMVQMAVHDVKPTELERKVGEIIEFLESSKSAESDPGEGPQEGGEEYA